jgi:hypothetical protein
MPQPPEGEADLRRLADRFRLADLQLEALALEAAGGGDRRALLLEALAALTALRREDMRAPVLAAYLAAFRAARRGRRSPKPPHDLAASLHRRLDGGTVRAADSARQVFRTVNPGNTDDARIVARTDRRGTDWGLGRWAEMNCVTIGRQSSSRGLSHGVGEGGRVTISAGQCSWCRDHSGEGKIGEVALPPFHPSCSCVATAA